MHPPKDPKNLLIIYYINIMWGCGMCGNREKRRKRGIGTEMEHTYLTSFYVRRKIRILHL